MNSSPIAGTQLDFHVDVLTTHCSSHGQLEGSNFCEQPPYIKWSVEVSSPTLMIRPNIRTS